MIVLPHLDPASSLFEWEAVTLDDVAADEATGCFCVFITLLYAGCVCGTARPCEVMQNVSWNVFPGDSGDGRQRRRRWLQQQLLLLLRSRLSRSGRRHPVRQPWQGLSGLCSSLSARRLWLLDWFSSLPEAPARAEARHEAHCASRPSAVVPPADVRLVV